jgi:hypothetical protein
MGQEHREPSVIVGD